MIIAVAIAVVAMVAAGVAVAVGFSSHDSAAPQAASVTSTTTPAVSRRVVPSHVLPTEQQMRDATLLDLSKRGEVDTTQYPDPKTDPPNCSLLSRPAAASVVGRAISVAGQAFRDKPGNDYGATGYGYVAVFETSDDARAGLQKLTQATQGCNSFRDMDADTPDASRPLWTVTDPKTTDHQVTWSETESTDDATPWACAKAVRAQDNLLVMATVCAPNPASGPNKIIDVILTNVDAQK